MECLPDSLEANFDLIGFEQLQQRGRKNGMCAETQAFLRRAQFALKSPAMSQTRTQETRKLRVCLA